MALSKGWSLPASRCGTVVARQHTWKHGLLVARAWNAGDRYGMPEFCPQHGRVEKRFGHEKFGNACRKDTTDHIRRDLDEQSAPDHRYVYVCARAHPGMPGRHARLPSASERSAVHHKACAKDPMLCGNAVVAVSGLPLKGKSTTLVGAFRIGAGLTRTWPYEFVHELSGP